MKNPDIIFDLEGDGLEPTKIHVFSWKEVGGKVKSTSDYNLIREVVSSAGRLIGHNIILFDVPVLERLLGVSIKAELVDTLALSWYLYPKRPRHGLEGWGEDLGIPKPEIVDWESLSYEEYKHRCEEDVKITELLWNKCSSYLDEIYKKGGNKEGLVKYLSFKVHCVRLQEESKWRLDVEKAEANLERLSKELEEKRGELEAAMPRVPIYTVKTRPKKPYKADRSLSALGVKWFALLEERGLHEDTTKVTYISGHNPPNASSVPQVKDWLYSLGWIPETFKYNRNKETGDIKKVPQIKSDKDDGSLCPSVLALAEEVPAILLLEGYGVLQHRIGILKGFLSSYKDGYLKASVGGLTNTLRFKHKELVNLPGVGGAYGKEIRECLIAPEGYELCGSDQSSLEDRTKQHYMFEYDPEYVEEMNEPGFDPHTALAVSAGAMTEDEEKFFKWFSTQ